MSLKEIRDITARLDRREELAAIDFFTTVFLAPQDAAVLTNASGTILSADGGFFDITGYMGREVFGKQVEMLIPDELREQHKKYREIYAKSPTPRQMGKGEPFPLQRKNQEIINVKIALLPYGSYVILLLKKA